MQASASAQPSVLEERLEGQPTLSAGLARSRRELRKAVASVARSVSLERCAPAASLAAETLDGQDRREDAAVEAGLCHDRALAFLPRSPGRSAWVTHRFSWH
jgi:hypothetical protein